jgi:glyoxylase-like metal-dependent hydrolase (beta-lactamase superfamily II)
VAGGECVLVDTLFDLPRTRSLLADVESTAGRRPSVVVNTHNNGDHCFGNQLVADVPIVGHRRCREALLAEAGLPPLFASIVASSETDGAVGFLRRAFASFDFDGITVTPPGVVFDETYDLGVAQLRYFGPAHTLADVVVHVPSDGVVFTGDLFFNGSTPVVWGSVSGWIAAVDEVLALDASVYVPGHGPVADAGALRTMREYLELVRSHGAALRAAGMDAIEAAMRFELGPFGSWVDAERIAVNLMRLYHELDGGAPSEPIDAMTAFGAMASVAARG